MVVAILNVNATRLFFLYEEMELVSILGRIQQLITCLLRESLKIFHRTWVGSDNVQYLATLDPCK